MAEITINVKPNDPFFMNAKTANYFRSWFFVYARMFVSVCVSVCCERARYAMRISIEKKRKAIGKIQIRKTKNGLRIKFQWLWTELNDAMCQSSSQQCSDGRDSVHPIQTAFAAPTAAFNENKTDAVICSAAVRISDASAATKIKLKWNAFALMVLRVFIKQKIK